MIGYRFGKSARPQGEDRMHLEPLIFLLYKASVKVTTQRHLNCFNKE
jgi:hypothetical protein